MMQPEYQYLVDTAVRRINRTCECGKEMELNVHKTFLYKGSVVKNVPYLFCECGNQEEIDPVLFAIQEEQGSNYQNRKIIININKFKGFRGTLKTLED